MIIHVCTQAILYNVFLVFLRYCLFLMEKCKKTYYDYYYYYLFDWRVCIITLYDKSRGILYTFDYYTIF